MRVPEPPEGIERATCRWTDAKGLAIVAESFVAVAAMGAAIDGHVLGALIAATAGLLALRTLRCAVHVDPDGLVITGVARSITAEWSDVAEVATVAGPIWLSLVSPVRGRPAARIIRRRSTATEFTFIDGRRCRPLALTRVVSRQAEEVTRIALLFTR